MTCITRGYSITVVCTPGTLTRTVEYGTKICYIILLILPPNIQERQLDFVLYPTVCLSGRPDLFVLTITELFGDEI